jgi:hypothetical protein
MYLGVDRDPLRLKIGTVLLILSVSLLIGFRQHVACSLNLTKPPADPSRRLLPYTPLSAEYLLEPTIHIPTVLIQADLVLSKFYSSPCRNPPQPPRLQRPGTRSWT